jgi:hypothetical protein
MNPGRVRPGEAGHDPGRLPDNRLGGLTLVMGRRTPEIDGDNAIGSN